MKLTLEFEDGKTFQVVNSMEDLTSENIGCMFQSILSMTFPNNWYTINIHDTKDFINQAV